MTSKDAGSTSSFDAFIGKFNDEHRRDLSDIHGTCWDEDGAILYCRACGIEFGLLTRKHHCRECGGIYCDHCAPVGGTPITPESRSHSDPPSPQSDGIAETTTPSAGSTPTSPSVPATFGWYPGKLLGRKPPPSTSPSAGASPDTNEETRRCVACKAGTSPGLRVRRSLLEVYIKRQKVAGFVPPPPSRVLPMRNGSMYGEDGKGMVRSDGLAAHASGYIEIFNKTDQPFAVKLFVSGSDMYREACRPNYNMVPAGSTIYAEIDPAFTSIDAAVLFGLPNRKNSNAALLAAASSGAPKNIEKESSTGIFQFVTIYTIDMTGRNAVLKYQGSGLLDMRKGTTAKIGRSAQGVLGSLLGQVTSQAEIHKSFFDMDTNIDTIDYLYSSNPL